MSKDLGKQVGETLYGLGKKGQELQWKVYTNGDTVTCEFGQIGGKLREQVTVVTSKNVGRANETSAEEQAVLEAESKWRKKYDKYYRPTLDEVRELETDGVMLAENYVDKPHMLADDFLSSRKLNGVRCKSVYKDGVLRFESRGGKAYPVPPHLLQPLIDMHETYGYSMYDGELYVHGHPLGRIQSASKVTTALTPLLEYHIFDIPIIDTPYEEVAKIMEGLVPTSDKVIISENLKVSKEQLDDIQRQFMAEGYEGVMLRNAKGTYHFRNKRSNDLLKFKLFKDSEAKVIDVEVDKLDEGVLVCQWGNNVFKCKMTGTHEYRAFENMKTLLGAWINFTYQETTEDGNPEFPVGRYVRECDENGKPLE